MEVLRFWSQGPNIDLVLEDDHDFHKITEMRDF